MTVLWPNGTKTEPTISSPYGPRQGGDSNFHHGTDFIGFTTGKSVLDGVVTLAGQYTANAGISVAVDSKDPVSGKVVTIVYMHASKVLVRKGDKVKAGDSLLIVGHTGNATGNCDHTEIRYWSGGKYTTVDPVPTIKKWMAYTPLPGRATRRTVPNAHVNGRTSPTTAAKVVQTLPPDTVGTFDGYRPAQSIQGNNIWFRGAFGKNWFWSGGFTNHSTSGLPKV